MLQHIATQWPNARNMLRPAMLRYVVLACCDRLAGALRMVYTLRNAAKNKQNSVYYYDWILFERTSVYRVFQLEADKLVVSIELIILNIPEDKSVYCLSDISNVFGNSFLFPDFFMFLIQLLMYYMHQHKISSHGNYFLYDAIYNKKITSALHQLDGRFIELGEMVWLFSKHSFQIVKQRINSEV